MSMTEAPLSWIKEIQTTLIDAGAFPLSGNAPDFPWEQLSQKLGALLHFSEFKIFPRKTAIMQSGAIASGFGSGFVSMALDLIPLSGQVFWLMGKDDVAKLTALALTSSQEGKGFSSPKFQEGFYYFLATQAVLAISELKALEDLSLKIAKPASPPQEEALCVDVEIQCGKQTFWGRLVCPASFHSAFKTHFSNAEPPALTSAFAKQMDVVVRVELGQTALALSQWKKVRAGDFILLDRCSFDPKTQKGTATLVLEETPLFRARLKDNSLKIVDYASYREEKNPMDTDIPEDETNPEEEFLSEEPSEENHLWSSETASAEKMISSKEIPLTLTVEVARLKLNLEKLLELSPGNVLELPVRPEQGVSITIGGKTVAKAELIRLGEMLGVKILQMGE